MIKLVPLRLLHAIGFTNLSDSEIEVYYDVLHGRYHLQKQISDLKNILLNLEERTNLLETQYNIETEELVVDLLKFIKNKFDASDIKNILRNSYNPFNFNDRENFLFATILYYFTLNKDLDFNCEELQIIEKEFYYTKRLKTLLFKTESIFLLNDLKNICKKVGAQFSLSLTR